MRRADLGAAPLNGGCCAQRPVQQCRCLGDYIARVGGDALRSLETVIAATHGSPAGVHHGVSGGTWQGNKSTAYPDAAGVLEKGGDGRTATNRSAAAAAGAWEDEGVGRQSIWGRGRRRHDKAIRSSVSRGGLLQRSRYELIRCSPVDL
jgi:hypothetical protein